MLRLQGSESGPFFSVTGKWGGAQSKGNCISFKASKFKKPGRTSRFCCVRSPPPLRSVRLGSTRPGPRKGERWGALRHGCQKHRSAPPSRSWGAARVLLLTANSSHEEVKNRHSSVWFSETEKRGKRRSSTLLTRMRDPVPIGGPGSSITGRL